MNSLKELSSADIEKELSFAEAGVCDNHKETQEWLAALQQEKLSRTATFAQRVKYARNCAGYTQKELAGILGFTNQQAVCEIESGRNETSTQRIAKIAQSCAVSADWLVSGKV